MSIVFAKELGWETGDRIFEPLVDYNQETGEIYIPRYNNRDILKAHEEGEARGYLAQGMKMVYVPYPIYQELKEQLSALLNKLSAIQQELNGVNLSEHREVSLWEFMVTNSAMLYGAGAKLMLREGGGCCVITDEEYAEMLRDKSDEDEDDLYGEECPEDDVPDEDPEEDEDEEPEEHPRHIHITIYPHPGTDD